MLVCGTSAARRPPSTEFQQDQERIFCSETSPMEAIVDEANSEPDDIHFDIKQ